MKSFFSYIIVPILLFNFTLQGAEQKQPLQNELSTLDALINATQQSLDNQKKIRELFVQYQKLRTLAQQNPDDNEQLIKMVKSAQRLLNSIEENNLSQNFDPDFMTELALFAQIASKRGIPKQ